jgi:beta-glucosidase
MSPPPQAFSTLGDSVRAGIVSESYVRRAAANNLREKFATGLFDGAAIINEAAMIAGLDLPADRALAYEAAVGGITLLKNDAVAGRPLLPLTLGTGGATRVAALGPLAGCVDGEHYPCLAEQGMTGHYVQMGARVVTLVEALGNVSGIASVSHVAGASIDDYDESGIAAAVAAAAAADVAIIAVGDSIPIGKGSCSEMHDSDTIDLPGSQLALIAAVAALGSAPAAAAAPKAAPKAAAKPRARAPLKRQRDEASDDILRAKIYGAPCLDALAAQALAAAEVVVVATKEEEER